jgi:nitrogenase molybdenum-iron protein NifN
MANASFTIGLGISMEPAAKLLQQRFGIEYCAFDSVTGLADSDRLMQTLTEVSGRPVPGKYERQRKVLVDAMRDAHPLFGGKKACIALDPDLAVQTSRWLEEMGAVVDLAIIPTLSEAADRIHAKEVQIGDLFAVKGTFDVLIANSHAESASGNSASRSTQMGLPVYKTPAYVEDHDRLPGTLTMINEVGNLMMKNIDSQSRRRKERKEIFALILNQMSTSFTSRPSRLGGKIFEVYHESRIRND